MKPVIQGIINLYHSAVSVADIKVNPFGFNVLVMQLLHHTVMSLTAFKNLWQMRKCNFMSFMLFLFCHSWRHTYVLKDPELLHTWVFFKNSLCLNLGAQWGTLLLIIIVKRELGLSHGKVGGVDTAVGKIAIPLSARRGRQRFPELVLES